MYINWLDLHVVLVLSAARAFIWEGEMGVALQVIWHLIKQALCLIWGMKEAIHYKTGRAAPPGFTVEKNSQKKHF